MVPLQPQQEPDIVEAEHRLGQGDEDEGGDPVPVVLLPDGIGDQAPFDIVADHGRGEGAFRQRRKAGGQVPGDLLEVEPHIGDLPIARQPEAADGGKICSLGHFLIHITAVNIPYLRGGLQPGCGAD